MGKQEVVLDGELSLNLNLDGDVLLDINLDGDVSLDLQVDGSADKIIKVTDYDAPVYTGLTKATPDFVGTVLQTAQKLVMENISVNPIQVESVSNPQGGRTVYIGGIV